MFRRPSSSLIRSCIRSLIKSRARVYIDYSCMNIDIVLVYVFALAVVRSLTFVRSFVHSRFWMPWRRFGHAKPQYHIKSQVGIDINGTLKLLSSMTLSQAGRNESSDISTESRIPTLTYRQSSYLNVSLTHKSIILKFAYALRKIRSRYSKPRMSRFRTWKGTHTKPRKW